MKNYVINQMMNYIIQKNSIVDDEQKEVIRYGLLSIYLSFTKLFFIIILAFIIGYGEKVLIFLILYNIIRTTSYGLHANKSWICLVSSSIIFIGVPILANNLIISNLGKYFLGILLIIFIFKNSPADTKKRPIIGQKRRWVLKLLSTIIAIIYVTISLSTNNYFHANACLLALLVQCIMISPLIYKLFNQTYNNYRFV